MAERRMFSKTIIDSDAFLEMPLSTQALYFHLSMRADDDGFLNNPKKIQRIVGASEDDLKLLILKNFIFTFDSGVVVIRHWRIHNYIQKDRYHPTLYQDEMSMLGLKCDNSYSLEATCIQDVHKTDTQVRLGKVSLGKDSLGKDSLGDIDTSTAEKRLTIDYQQILALYNEKCPSLTRAEKLTEKRRKGINARMRNYTLDDFIKVFELAEQSSFLRGEKSNNEHANWKADLDFLLREDKFVKILEGGYKDFGSAKLINKEADRMEQEYDRIRDWAESRSESSASDG